VQAIQSSHAKAGTVAASQFCAGIPNRLWQVNPEPQSASQIALQFRLRLSRLTGRNLFPENMLRYGVHPFRAMEGSEPEARF